MTSQTSCLRKEGRYWPHLQVFCCVRLHDLAQIGLKRLQEDLRANHHRQRGEAAVDAQQHQKGKALHGQHVTVEGSISLPLACHARTQRSLGQTSWQGLCNLGYECASSSAYPLTQLQYERIMGNTIDANIHDGVFVQSPFASVDLRVPLLDC